MRVFISQPMNNKSDAEIKEERKKMEEIACQLSRQKVEVVESFFEAAPHDARPLWFLGKSLELLSTADVILFAPGWENARGCIMEHEAAVRYGIPILVD